MDRPHEPNRRTARAWALAASTSRFLGAAEVTSERRSFSEVLATSAAGGSKLKGVLIFLHISAPSFHDAKSLFLGGAGSLLLDLKSTPALMMR